MPSISRLTESQKNRFWSHVTKSDGCWVWSQPGSEYGKFSLGKKADGSMAAHRASWVVHFGRIPDGLLVCHRCDVPKCVNPDHLFLGTPKDNALDMVAKGRSLHGEAAFKAKLTAEIALKCRRLYRSGAATTYALGAQFGVTKSVMRYLLIGKSWGGVEALTNEEMKSISARHLARNRPRGESHGSSVLTEDRVIAIRSAFSNGAKIRALAREFCVSQRTVQSVVRGETWLI